MKKKSKFSCLLKLYGIAMLIVSIPLASVRGSCSCNHAGVVEELSISNDGIKWIVIGHLPEPRIVGEMERDIMLMKTPPSIDSLMICLERTNQWKAAHVLISYRYLGSYTATSDGWNGLNPSKERDQSEDMKEILKFWNIKRNNGELDSVVPVASKKKLTRVFGDKDPQEKSATEMSLRNKHWAIAQFGGNIPAENVLFESLNDTNKWRAAHILLIDEYQTTNCINIDAEGLFTTDEVEMKKVQEYWIKEKNLGNCNNTK